MQGTDTGQMNLQFMVTALERHAAVIAGSARRL